MRQLILQTSNLITQIFVHSFLLLNFTRYHCYLTLQPALLILLLDYLLLEVSISFLLLRYLDLDFIQTFLLVVHVFYSEFGIRSAEVQLITTFLELVAVLLQF